MHVHQCKSLLVIALFLMNGLASADSKRIKKWVDEKGVTHYGDVLPPDYAGEEMTEMNSRGITVKRKEVAANPKEQQSGKVKELTEQERRDKALLNSFTTAKEIDLARDRNLQMDQANIHSLKLRLTDAEQRLEKSNASIAEFSKNKKPVPADLAEDKKNQQADVNKIKDQIAQKQSAMDETRNRFENDKKRFIELKSGNGPSSASESAQPPTPAPAAP